MYRQGPNYLAISPGILTSTKYYQIAVHFKMAAYKFILLPAVLKVLVSHLVISSCSYPRL